ncbi:hypothetical protein YC2023_018008 [Brassica napus]
MSEIFYFLEGSTVQGPSLRFPLAGTRGTHLPGIRGSESCLEAGGNNTGIFFPNSLPLISRLCHRSRGITCALESTGVAHSQQAPEMTRLAPCRAVHARFEEGRFGCLILPPAHHRIGVRVHSRPKIGDKVCESMSSSGSSLGLSAKIEEIKNAAMGETSPLPKRGGSLPVGTISEIGVEEVVFWRQKFHLSTNIVIQIPGPFDKVSDFRAGEVPVYEGFFESVFRDQVPSLIAEVSRAVNISPGQLNPPAWRILMAMQNLVDLEGLVVGVAENVDIICILAAVQELSRSEEKHHPVFEGNWASKFAFMRLPGFSSTWRTAGESRRVLHFLSTFMILTFFIFPSIDIYRADFSSGRHVIEQLLGLPVDRREILFLVSEEALDRCSIRGKLHICNFPVSFSLFVE